MSAFALLAGTALVALTPGAAVTDDTTDAQRKIAEGQTGADILVQGRLTEAQATTKTDTPAIEVPQPVTVIASETYLAQGAISVADTMRYAAGVLTDSYGRDTRVDTFTIRGVSALQFRDGMRDIYSYYVNIASDPYNFSRVEVVRGPASVLFGQGSIGGLVNLVSKTPVFTNTGEVQLTYGSFDRKEVLADLNLAAGDKLAGRIVARVRDAGTYVARTRAPTSRCSACTSRTRPDRHSTSCRSSARCATIAADRHLIPISSSGSPAGTGMTGACGRGRRCSPTGSAMR
jgi:iron complex outermembrane receptor protein